MNQSERAQHVMHLAVKFSIFSTLIKDFSQLMGGTKEQKDQLHANNIDIYVIKDRLNEIINASNILISKLSPTPKVAEFANYKNATDGLNRLAWVKANLTIPLVELHLEDFANLIKSQTSEILHELKPGIDANQSYERKRVEPEVEATPAPDPLELLEGIL